MAGDANFANVVLLLPCNGTDGSTDFPDYSALANTVTAAGDACVDTSTSEHGSGSLQCAGAGYLRIPTAGGVFDFGSDPLAIEFSLKPASSNANGYVMGLRTGNDVDTIRWCIHLYDGYLNFDFWSTSDTRLYYGGQTTTRCVAGVWQKAAITRDSSGVFRSFLGGDLLEASSATSGAVSNSYAYLDVGKAAGGFGGDGLPFTGHIDEIRITKGVARYTEAYTPDASAFPLGSVQVAGVVLDSDGEPAARIVRVYRRDTGALIDSATSDAGTGEYTIYVPTADEVIVVCLDNDADPLENDLILRTIPV